MKYQKHPKSIIKNTAKKLHGFERRIYIAEITIELPDKSARKAEKAMKICEERLERLGNLPKWDVTIEPVFG